MDNTPKFQEPVPLFADDAPSLISDELASKLNPEEGPLTEAEIENFKRVLSGLPKDKKVRPQRYWYNGDLISREEHDKLSWQERHDSSNRGNSRLK
jgi:hypothetical protein